MKNKEGRKGSRNICSVNFTPIPSGGAGVQFFEKEIF